MQSRSGSLPTSPGETFTVAAARVGTFTSLQSVDLLRILGPEEALSSAELSIAPSFPHRVQAGCGGVGSEGARREAARSSSSVRVPFGSFGCWTAASVKGTHELRAREAKQPSAKAVAQSTMLAVARLLHASTGEETRHACRAYRLQMHESEMRCPRSGTRRPISSEELLQLARIQRPLLEVFREVLQDRC